jgi:polysaccharide export outer membrane protein
MKLLLALLMAAPAFQAAPVEDPPDLGASPAYRVGAGDVLSITVFGHPDLSQSPAIQPSGTIVMPLLREVSVAGLTVVEVQRKLRNLLERDYLVEPQVHVEVREYQSQYVIVLGEVNSPGRKPLRGATRLIDALVDAGGFKPTASAEVTITRTEGSFGDGQKTLRIHLSGTQMTAQDEINLSLPLLNGDVITALGQRHVTVEGEVSRPGRYVTDGELTLSGALSLAGGRTRFASDDVTIRRRNPETAEVTILEVDVDEVRKGKQEDLVLQPQDVVTVPRRRF